jgi:hypothetical protein
MTPWVFGSKRRDAGHPEGECQESVVGRSRCGLHEMVCERRLRGSFIEDAKFGVARDTQAVGALSRQCE